MLKAAEFPMFIAIEDKNLPSVIIINESKEAGFYLINTREQKTFSCVATETRGVVCTI